MQNYKTEDNINFYEQLYKLLDEPDNNNTNSNNEDGVCLITNLPLTHDYIALECNHKFNYDAIYHDILNHKKKYNAMENHIIKSNEIRCPYCRTVQTKLLPPKDGYKTVHGVNFFDAEQDLIDRSYGCNSNYIYGKCSHEYPCTGSNEVVGCKNKHVKYLTMDQKYYCHTHYSISLNAICKANRLKQREDKKLALLKKIKDKEEQLKAKEEKKLQKEEKKLQKVEKQAKKQENVILSSLQEGCSQLLKTGKNKGLACGLKCHNGQMCLRHYNLFSATHIVDSSCNTI